MDVEERGPAEAIRAYGRPGVGHDGCCRRRAEALSKGAAIVMTDNTRARGDPESGPKSGPHSRSYTVLLTAVRIGSQRTGILWYPWY